MRSNASVVAAGIGLLLAAAGSAFAGITPVDGDIIFVSQQDSSIRYISGFGPSVAQTLYSFPDAGDFPAGITKGPDGAFYVSRSRLPVPNAGAGIVRITDLFGTPNATELVTGDPLQNPIGLSYSDATGRLLTVSNPGSSGMIRGIFDISLGGVVTPVASEVNGGTGYRSGTSLTRDPNSSDYFVSAINGGAFDPMTLDGQASTLWRLSYNNGTNDYSLDPTPIVDFTDILGPGNHLTNVRGIVAIPGTNDIYAADFVSESIYRITLDAMGDFQSISLVIGGLDEPENLIYNPYTNKLIIDERGGLTNSVISQINLDGSGYEVLATGDHARGFYIVPTPAGFALAPIAGLFAMRRRRA